MKLDNTSDSSFPATLCGCAITEFPRGSGHSVTIGGIIEINGEAYLLTNGHITASARDEPQRSLPKADTDTDEDDPAYQSKSILLLDNWKLPNIRSATSPIDDRHSPTKCKLPQMYLITVARTACTRKVIVLTGSGRHCSGTLLTSEFDLCLPSGDFVLTWMVRLDYADGKHVSDRAIPVLILFLRTSKGRFGLLGNR